MMPKAASGGVSRIDLFGKNDCATDCLGKLVGTTSDLFGLISRRLNDQKTTSRAVVVVRKKREEKLMHAPVASTLLPSLLTMMMKMKTL